MLRTLFFTYPDKSFQSSDPLPHPLPLGHLHLKQRGGGSGRKPSIIRHPHRSLRHISTDRKGHIRNNADRRPPSFAPTFLRYAFASSDTPSFRLERSLPAPFEARSSRHSEFGIATDQPFTPSLRTQAYSGVSPSLPLHDAGALSPPYPSDRARRCVPPWRKLVLTNPSFPPPPDRHSVGPICPREGPESSNPPEIPGRSAFSDELVGQPVYGLKGRI